MKLARFEPEDAPSAIRGVAIAVVLGVALGALVLMIATRLGSAIGT